jgi:signal peptidase I
MIDMDTRTQTETASASNEQPNDHDSPASGAAPEKAKFRFGWQDVISMAMAILLVFTIRSSVVEAFKIPSGSMIPTLLVGDHIFVNKFAYGIKVPFSDLITGAPVYVIKRDPPKRGDIIVFIFPKDESFHFIKRVVGVPGDTIEIRNKQLLINGQPAIRADMKREQADRIFGAMDDPRHTRENLDVFNESFAQDDPGHTIMLDKNNFLGDSFGPVTVPAESLFVMGDNRDSSNDSRFWGFVPFKNVKGKAVVIWLSLWISLSDNQLLFRPGRIGDLLR